MPEISSDFSHLADACRASRSHRAGERVFAERDPGDCMYVVRSGAVEIRRAGRVVETIGPGGIFGEMSLIDGSPRSADAHVSADCDLLEIDEKAFVHLVHEMPLFALDVMRILAARIRSMNELI